jgi:hypothetical protein
MYAFEEDMGEEQRDPKIKVFWELLEAIARLEA